MKYPFAVLLLLVAQVPAFSQKLYPLRDKEDSIRFKIAVQNRRLVLEPQGETTLFKAENDFPAIVAVRMEEADLVLEYRPVKSKDAVSEILPRLQLPDGQTITPQSYELSRTPERLAWLDAAERMNDFEGVYTLFVHHSLMGAVNCEGLRPEFTLKKKMPHYAAAGLGLALVGLGQVYAAQKRDYYDTYRRLWQEGEPRPGANDNPLEKARDKDKAAQICTWAGAGILAADVALYVYRYLKIRGKQRTYDKFCGKEPSLSFEPSLQSSGAGVAFEGCAPGFRITFSF